MKTVAVRTALLILIVLTALVYGCKKDKQKTFAETLAGTYKMNGAWYETYWLYNAVSGTPYDTTVVLKSYTDTIIGIMAFNDSLNMGGIFCYYNPGYAPQYTFLSDRNNTPGLKLTFYKNDTDSAMFYISGYLSHQTHYFAIFTGRKM